MDGARASQMCVRYVLLGSWADSATSHSARTHTRTHTHNTTHTTPRTPQCAAWIRASVQSQTMARSAMRWRCATPNRRLLLPPLLPHRVCMHRRVHAHRCTLIVLSLIDYPVVALCVCVGSPLCCVVSLVCSSSTPAALRCAQAVALACRAARERSVVSHRINCVRTALTRLAARHLCLLLQQVVTPQCNRASGARCPIQVSDRIAAHQHSHSESHSHHQLHRHSIKPEPDTNSIRSITMRR